MLKESNINDLDPDKVDANELDEVENVPDNELELDPETLDEKEFEEKLEEKIEKRENFEGFSGAETEDLKQDIIDIGLYGKARGKIYNESEISTDFFITIEESPNKSKILVIGTNNDFDEFTGLYGKINKKDKKLYILWDLVSDKYKGFYLKSSATVNRDIDVPFGDSTATSWINNDFTNINEIIIFRKIKPMLKFNEIKKPFKAKILDEYAINSDQFVKISEQITYSGILLIDDVKSFDIFTNKYGRLITNKKDPYIEIDWNMVKKHYEGFYIDKDNDFEKVRYSITFYNDKQYKSWWEIDKIASGIVYIFE